MKRQTNPSNRLLRDTSQSLDVSPGKFISFFHFPPFTRASQMHTYIHTYISPEFPMSSLRSASQSIETLEAVFFRQPTRERERERMDGRANHGGTKKETKRRVEQVRIYVYLLVDIKANIIPSSLLLALSPSLSYALLLCLRYTRTRAFNRLLYPRLILSSISLLPAIPGKSNTSKNVWMLRAEQHCKVKSSTFPLARTRALSYGNPT